jgi:hypothetical protein
LNTLSPLYHVFQVFCSYICSYILLFYPTINKCNVIELGTIEITEPAQLTCHFGYLPIKIEGEKVLLAVPLSRVSLSFEI